MPDFCRYLARGANETSGGREKAMPKDRLERRTYRKSPGRQYGYDYDPLQSSNGSGQSGRDGQWATQGRTTKRSNTQLVQRPDPRRTRQLLRQNIIASKARSDSEEEPSVEQQEVERQPQHFLEQEEQNYQQTPLTSRTRSGRAPQAHVPSTRELMPADEDEGEWQDYEEIDPDIGYEDPLEARFAPSQLSPYRSTDLSPAARTLRDIPGVPERSRRRSELEEYDDEYDDYEDERLPTRRPARKRNVSRRGLLVGLGVAAIGGTSIAAYELGPKLVGNVGTNIEHQLQDAFNKGLAQGADAVRKDFITSLENLEGFTLGGAQTAARLTRVAYDVFVSPIVKFGSVVAADFLGAMLRAFKSGRHILAVVNQDNDTLAAIQSVLESWVAQISNLPKQLDTITQTDLDGAQAYLRALQRKLDEEKAKLNNSGKQSTPGPTSKH